MLFEDVLEEYMYRCQAKGFTAKTLKKKRLLFNMDEIKFLAIESLRNTV